MQQDLLALFDAEPATDAPSAPQPQFQLVTIAQPEVKQDYSVSNCGVCGGTGACYARSHKTKVVPCTCCSGYGKKMHDQMGRRLPMRMMVPLLNEMGIDIPDHANRRY